jgi:hypothetical protein
MPGSAGAGGITFDRFVRACVVIKQLTEAFQRLDTDRVGLYWPPGSISLTLAILGRMDPNQLRSIHVYRPRRSLNDGSRLNRRESYCNKYDSDLFLVIFL